MEIISFNTKKSAIAKNAFLGLLFQFIVRFKGVIILPLIVHFLPKEVLGEWRLISTTVSILFPILFFNIFDGSGMFFSADVNKKSVRVKYYTLFNLSIILISVYSIIFILYLIFSDKIKLTFIAYLIYFISVVVQKMSIMLLQTYQKSKILLTVNFVAEYGSVAITCLMIWLGYRNIEVLILPLIVMYFAISVFMQAQIRKEIPYTFIIDRSFLKQVLPVAIPLIPVYISEWILNSIGVYCLKYYSGLEIVGTYSILLSLASLILMLRSTLQFFWFSTCSNLIRTDLNTFIPIMRQVIKVYITLIVLLLACYCFYSKILILVLADSSYLSIDIPLMIMSIGYGFMILSTIWNGILYAKEKSKDIMNTYMLSAFVVLVLSFILVKYYSILGAAISYSVGNLILFISLYKYGSKAVRFNLDKKELVTTIILCGVVVTMVIIKFLHLSDSVQYILGVIYILLIILLVIILKYVSIDKILKVLIKK